MFQVWRILPVLLAATFVVGACTNLNSSSSGDVLDAHVVRIVEASTRTPLGGAPDQPFQRLEIMLDSGFYRGELATVEWRGRGALNQAGLLSVGDRVLVTEVREGPTRLYAIQDIVRLPALVPFVVLLVLALLVVARRQGFTSLLGLVASGAVLLFGVVPAIRSGADPLFGALAGSAGVLVLSVVGVHGLNRKSAAALIGTLGGLAVVGALATVVVNLAHLTGLASEEAVYVLIGSPVAIDPSRLVLAGIVIGSLGALVDLSVGQASTTFELAAVDYTLRGRALYASAQNVGRDHIGSLVNTLAFAYFGGALPLIVFLSLGFTPLSLALNSEEIASAIAQAVIASSGLVLCVPLTTAAAVLLVREGRS